MKRLLAIMVAGVVFALAPASAAFATPTPDDGAATPVSAPVQVYTAGPSSAAICANTTGAMDVTYLPMSRWIDQTSTFHSRATSGFLGLNGMLTTSQRAAQGTMFSIGNFFFGLAGQLTAMSTQFCPMAQVGGIVDQAAASLAQAMVKSAIVTGVVVMAIIGLLWAGVRGQRPGWFKDLAVKALVLGLFAIMLAGSAASTGGGINGSTAEYKPGVGSPGWFATTIDTTVSNFATLPAQAISSGTVSRVTSLSDSDASDPFNCQRYTIALLRLYANHANGTVDKNGEVTSALDGVAAPAMVVSNLWEISGLNAFTVAQFGSQNTDGKMRVVCRMLELRSGIPLSGSFAAYTGNSNGSNAQASTSYASQSMVWNMVWGAGGAENVAGKLNAQAPAWHRLDDIQEDLAYFAFATCSPKNDDWSNITSDSGWHVRRGAVGQLVADDDTRKSLSSDGATTSKFNEACYNFYNTSGETVDSIFDWGDASDKINKTQGLPLSTIDFVGTLHGTGASGGAESVISYLLSSVSVFAVFGMLSLVVAAAKLMSMFMLFTVFVMMVATLLPNSNPDKLVKYTKEYVSWSLLSAFALLIMSVIILFTKVIIMASASLTGGPTSLLTMLMAGIAPAAAAFAVHRGFTQIGMPSPLTLKGGMSWGKAIAGGAATGAALGGVQALAGRAQNAASGVGRRLAGGAKSKAMGAVGLNRGQAGTQKAPVAGKTGGAARTSGERLGADGKRVEDWQSILNDPNASAERKKEAREALHQEKIDAGADTWKDHVGAASGVRASVAAGAGALLDSAADKVHAGVDAVGKFASDPRGAIGGAIHSASSAAWQATRYAASHPAQALKTAAKVGALGAVGVAGIATAGAAPVAIAGAAYAARKVQRAAAARNQSARDQQLRDYREKQHDEGVAYRKAEQDRIRAEEREAHQAQQQAEREARRNASYEDARNRAQDSQGEPVFDEPVYDGPDDWGPTAGPGNEYGSDALPPEPDFGDEDPRHRAPWVPAG